MNRKTYYLIADIIQKNRTWIKVIGTEKLVEMRILQDGMLKPLLFKTITLKSYREHYCFKRSCTWNINEYDLNMGLLALCLQPLNGLSMMRSLCVMSNTL